ncbi:type IV-A pilus assembly ATPase PilB [Candidatus Berkiella aquae]|uniref:Type II secretion system protein E n=2 Tax=Candidatus Berkiella aquae TaxID=295108 RepID=A0A0Q9YUP1_9GAMM|nr:type IV-A pilus assembly ATPase PilB [Candidatus Berkiella aquae]MCS5710829.1 type IV-A pilus assembly ATPase PilB [Candidatus Berkiella aquae]
MVDHVTLNGLSKKLVQTNLLDALTAAQAIDAAMRKKIPFVAHLIEKSLIDDKTLAVTASIEFGDPLFDLSAMDLDLIPKELVSEKLIRQHHALPLFRRGNRLFVAVSDPTNLEALDEFKFHTGISTEAIVVEETKLVETIEKILSENESSALDDLKDSDLDALDISSDDHEKKDEDSDSDVDDAPIVRFVNKVLLDAINRGASDIHFEPYEKQYRVRLRQDGILQEFAAPPVNLAPRLAARLKVMSRLDISERRVPQDGRFKMKLSRNRAIDFRVSTCPTLFGEKVVMRILDPSSAKIGIDALGYEEAQKVAFLNAIHKPQGMVLVTGPTGSGKTVSLYTAINILNTSEVNISTAEDPVEINLPGINQVNVNPKAGLTFSSALRAFLRQDPDIIMVGEVRDLETAEIAVKAAQTGHMVLSTLHTNSAPETLTRLMNMGIQAFNLATSVTLVIAQRLARRLCTHCKQVAHFPPEALIDVGFTEADVQENFSVFEPKGCDQCINGFKGRVGIYEVMPVSPAIGQIIMAGGNAFDIAAQMKLDNVINLRRAGLNKVKLGLTTIEEVNRVTKD